MSQAYGLITPDKELTRWYSLTKIQSQTVSYTLDRSILAPSPVMLACWWRIFIAHRKQVACLVNKLDVSQENVFAICFMRAIWTLALWLLATFQPHMPLQVSFPHVNLPTPSTRIGAWIRRWTMRRNRLKYWRRDKVLMLCNHWLPSASDLQDWSFRDVTKHFKYWFWIRAVWHQHVWNREGFS
jgi:hypothetical protein